MNGYWINLKMDNTLKPNKKYDHTSIKVLQGLAAVRKRPAMYIGSTDETGLHQLLWEIFDNAVDEYLNGFANQIKVTLSAQNTVTVQDNGRGIPTEMYNQKISTPVLIFTTLHAGGKFDSDTYRVAGGLHGVGASVVNALSDFFDVTIYRDKKITHLQFAQGGKLKSPLTMIGHTRVTGTKITFRPDNNIFGAIPFHTQQITKRLQQSAFLNSGLRIIFDNRTVRPHAVQQFYYQEGLQQYLLFINSSKKNVTPPIIMSGTVLHEMQYQVALQMTSDLQQQLLSFVNNIHTIHGGSHELGVMRGCMQALNHFFTENNFFKQKERTWDLAEIKVGLYGIINVLLVEKRLQFRGQTKNKLSSYWVQQQLIKIVERKLLFWLNEHRVLAQAWWTRLKNLRQMHTNIAQIKKKQQSLTKQWVINSKLIPASSRVVADRELFLVEGESAGSTAKQGRDGHFQAILALKGKILNTVRAKTTDIIQNQEIINLINTLGCGWGSTFQLDKIQYHKVIIMTDADHDGAHIQALILTFLYRFMRPLLTAGLVYLAVPPLFRVQTKKDTPAFYLYQQATTNTNLDADHKKYYRVQRFKGLGEMNPEQLWATTMNPATRHLIKVHCTHDTTQAQLIELIMGAKSKLRRRWIDEHMFCQEVTD